MSNTKTLATVAPAPHHFHHAHRVYEAQRRTSKIPMSAPLSITRKRHTARTPPLAHDHGLVAQATTLRTQFKTPLFDVLETYIGPEFELKDSKNYTQTLPLSNRVHDTPDQRNSKTLRAEGEGSKETGGRWE